MTNQENNNLNNENSEAIEGLDTTNAIGWGSYPLDSVFVRKENRTVNEVIKRIKADRFIMHPDFQRDFVWSLKKQSRLIESCLMRIPLPVFYVAEAKDGRIVVVDGLQRLTTFLRYLNNEFSLSQLGDGKEDSPQENALIGKKFNKLPLTLRERIEDTQITLYILDEKAPQRAKLDIFERVNSGEPLARQQMRNCLFNGPATRWLAKAADSDVFLDATGGSLNKKTMRDREAINRFCAFYLLGDKAYKSDMDDFLAKVLEKMNDMHKDDFKKLTRAFKNSMQINHEIFGKHAFRKSLQAMQKHADRTVINIALFDVCSVAFAVEDVSFVTRSYDDIWKDICELLLDSKFVAAITYGTNGMYQVRDRFQLFSERVKLC